MVGQAIEQCRGHLGVPEDAGPFAEAEVAVRLLSRPLQICAPLDGAGNACDGRRTLRTALVFCNGPADERQTWSPARRRGDWTTGMHACCSKVRISPGHDCVFHSRRSRIGPTGERFSAVGNQCMTGHIGRAV